MKKEIELNSVDKLFEFYVEELATVTEEDKKALKKQNNNVVHKEREMLTYIEELEISDSSKKELSKRIDDYLEDKSIEFCHYTEKYFKKGFSIGVSLIIDAIAKV